MLKNKNRVIALVAWFFASNLLAFTLIVYIANNLNKISSSKAEVKGIGIALAEESENIKIEESSKTPEPEQIEELKAIEIKTEEITLESRATEDKRAEIIDNYYAKFKCPMTGLGKKMVEEADKNSIPYWIVPAISWQESTCGKAMIKDSHNAYGYGIYGDKVVKFASWDEGIETMSRYMARRFFNQGVTEPCDIERTYTPPSKGRWCKSINYFKNQLKGNDPSIANIGAYYIKELTSSAE